MAVVQLLYNGILAIIYFSITITLAFQRMAGEIKAQINWSH